MKKIVAIINIILICTALCSSAQDLIVTQGDSINCLITKVKNDNVYFTFVRDGETRNSLLPMSQITTYQQNFYERSEIKNPNEIVGLKKDFERIRIAVNGGYSRGLGKIDKSYSNELTDYQKKLKNGMNLGGDFTYYFSEYFGAAIKGTFFKTSNSINAQNTETNRYGVMSDEIKTFFVGPMFSARFSNHNKKNAWIFGWGLGYVGYSNDFTLIDDHYKLSGSTLGTVWDIGYDISIAENLKLGFQLSMTGALLSKIKMDDGRNITTLEYDSDERLNTGHIDLSVGLRFGK